MEKPKDAIDNLVLADLHHATLPVEGWSYEWVINWSQLGVAHLEQRNFELALDYFRRADVLATQSGSPLVHGAFAGLALTYGETGQTEKAVHYYKRGLKLLETIQGQQGLEANKIGAFDRPSYIYRGLVTSLVHLYRKTGEEQYLHEAFHYNERLRARAFLDILGKSRATRLGEEVGSLTAKEEETRREIVKSLSKN